MDIWLWIEIGAATVLICVLFASGTFFSMTILWFASKAYKKFFPRPDPYA